MNPEITQILNSIESGDPKAANDLLPLVYDELRQLAHIRMAREANPSTMQATALVHEAYLRLIGSKTEPQWDCRGHFFAAAAEAMRRILIDKARKKNSLKRGGHLNRCRFLEDNAAIEQTDAGQLLDIDLALSKLESHDQELATLVKLRFFTGLTIEETAQIQGVSARTTKRNWAYARAWLRREIEGLNEPA